MMGMKSMLEVPKLKAKVGNSKPVRAVLLARKSGDFWHAIVDGRVQGFVSHARDGYTQSVELRSTSGRMWLGALFYRETQEALSRQESEAALDLLEAIAIHDGPCIPLHLRVADLGEEIFLDLADEEWQVVRIDAQGWEVLPSDRAPIRFRRPNGTEALPVPTRGGHLDELQNFIRTDAYGLSLLAAWMVGAMTDRGSAPVLSLGGVQGSAKSTATRAIQMLTDPRIAALRSAPKNDEELAIAARNARVLSFDNLSRITPNLSDGLARISSGAAFTTRLLYTNGEEAIIAARRPVIVNSIVDVIGRADLLERTVGVQLQQISPSDRIEESTFWPIFEAARSRLLGAILDGVTGVLARWGETRPAFMPRMADFYHIAIAAGDSLPGGEETFRAAWASMTESAVDVALESTPICAPLIALLERQKGWKAPAAALLRELNSQRPETHLDESWPQTPQGLSHALRRVTPALEARGWNVLLGKKNSKTGERNVVITTSTSVEGRIASMIASGMDAATARRQALLEVAS